MSKPKGRVVIETDENGKKWIMTYDPVLTNMLVSALPWEEDDDECDPPNACITHGRCWTHSKEA